jgi:prepilin-type N-terminal cleavage/methylation domain-containing protein
MTAHKRAGQRGFSLVEVLVAVTLFTLVSAGITSFAVSSMRRTSGNRASAGAVVAGQQELEDLRGLAYADIASRSYNTTIGNLSYSVATVVQNNTPAANMKQVMVSVSWTGPWGVQTHVLRTILTQITA